MTVQGFMDWKGNPVNKGKHGGARAANFIYFTVVMTSVAFVSNEINLVTYLRDTMHTGVASSSTIVTNFIGGTCAFALLGAFISDSYISRFKTIIIFGPLEILGFGLLALQAHLPPLQPLDCDTSEQSGSCKQVHGYKAALLYIAMYTTALGEGCLRANLASLGGDQFDSDDLVESQLKSSFFNWFVFGMSVGSFTGLVLIVWIENNKGWDYGFGLSALVVLLGLLVLASGSPFYRNQEPKGSPLTRILQVLVAAFRKRKLPLPKNVDELQEEFKNQDMVGMEILPHTKGFKFLEKASIYYGSTGAWSLCTVTQVEETKIVLRMLPVIISAVIGYIPIPLLVTFSVQQGSTMNTKLGSINISPASLLIIPILFQMVILVAYDQLFVPLARKITGYSSGITHLQRVGVGFVSTSAATFVAGMIERKRKNTAGVGVPMSVLWLGIQLFVVGITDVSSYVGLLEFFNSEASRGMKSIGTAIFWCVLGLSSLMGTSLVQVVNKVSRHDNGEIGWLEGKDLNESHLDWFYWLLSVLGMVGFLNYLYWAKRYIYRNNPRIATS